MPQPLPVISGREAANTLSKAGFNILPKRGKGSHMVLAKQGHPAIITIPDHRELDRGTLRSTIRSSGLTVDQFVELLKS